MIEIHPNYAAVKQGLIPLTPQEKLKQEKDGLAVIHDIYRYAKSGFAKKPTESFSAQRKYLLD